MNNLNIFFSFTFHHNIEQIIFHHQEIEMHAVFHVHMLQIDKIYNGQ